jgi:predicted anti-sigma-YlaC factor YlaD
MKGVDCGSAQEVLSADLDGQAGPLEVRAAKLHRDSCGPCSAWFDDVSLLQRRVRVRSAESVPDLSAVILERSHPPRPGRGEWVRYSLVVVALTQLVIALPDLIARTEPGTTAHESRHVGAMAVALALGLLYTAKVPARAYGILPITAALAATMLASAIFDVTRGSTPLLGESVHIVELVGFVLVWLLAGRPGIPRYLRRKPRSLAMPEQRLDEVA